MEGEINLLDYWRVIWKRKVRVALIVSSVTVGVLVYSFFCPDIYRTTATIMPLGGGQNANMMGAGVLNQMGLGALFGGVSMGGSAGQIQAILKSRTLAERVIERHGLMPILFTDLWDESKKNWKNSGQAPSIDRAVKRLSHAVSFGEEVKLQLVTISAEHEDQRATAHIANAYIEELDIFLRENTFTSAKKNRIFIENQLERNKAEYLKAGKDLSAFYAPNRISNVVPRVDVTISEVETNESSLSTSPVSGSSSPSSGFPGFSQAFADTKKRTEELEKKVRGLEEQIQTAQVVEAVPGQIYLQYLTLKRNLLEQTNILLTQQYEMAKIEEAKDDLNFQVVDSARVPKGKARPQRGKMAIAGLFASLFVAVFYAFAHEYVERLIASSRATS